jgi:hypothetical protein
MDDRILWITLVGVLAGTSPALAQTVPTACESQRSLEQVIQSEGELMPDDCRRLSITSIPTEVARLCQLNFQTPSDPGVLDRLTEATAPTQWWVECARLAEGANK